jgi:hypothetical protein
MVRTYSDVSFQQASEGSKLGQYGIQRAGLPRCLLILVSNLQDYPRNRSQACLTFINERVAVFNLEAII